VRITYVFIFGAACMVFATAFFFEALSIGDILKYCQQNNLMLIDEICKEDIFLYGEGLFMYGIGIAAAGMLLIVSVLISPELPSYGKGEGLKV
jgi:hypothetical protein